ncbi:MAG: response regulator transcription factor [Desulfobacterales bacterium]|nr:response regulator transcription factor [Desulfobacterales bacterium]
MNADTPVRIFLADDHPLLRTGLKFSLDKNDRVELIGEAEDGYRAVEKIKKNPPDVVLLDVDMPGLSGIGTIRILRRIYPDMKIVMLSTYNDDNYIEESMKAGADGYVLKCVSIDELVRIIISIWNGQPVFSPYLVNLTCGYGESEEKEELRPESRLTMREKQVLQLITDGKGNKAISTLLYISTETVKSHVKNIFRKLKVKNRVEAIMEARKRRMNV